MLCLAVGWTRTGMPSRAPTCRCCSVKHEKNPWSGSSETPGMSSNILQFSQSYIKSPSSAVACVGVDGYPSPDHLLPSAYCPLDRAEHRHKATPSPVSALLSLCLSYPLSWCQLLSTLSPQTPTSTAIRPAKPADLRPRDSKRPKHQAIISPNISKTFEHP